VHAGFYYQVHHHVHWADFYGVDAVNKLVDLLKGGSVGGVMRAASPNQLPKNGGINMVISIQLMDHLVIKMKICPLNSRLRSQRDTGRCCRLYWRSVQVEEDTTHSPGWTLLPPGQSLF